MKIAYLASIRLPTEKAHGGAIMSLCNAFSKAGHEVELIIPARENTITEDPFNYYKIPHSFKITTLALPVIRTNTRIGFVLSVLMFAVKVQTYMRGKSVDMYYTRDVFVTLFLRRDTVRIFEIHEQIGSFRWLIAKFGPSHIVTTTDAMHRLCVERGIRKERVLTAQNGVDDIFFDEHSSEFIQHSREVIGVPLNSFVFGYIGAFRNMGVSKGVEGIIQAFAVLSSRYPNTRLLLVGVGSSGREYVQLSVEKGVIPKGFIIVVDHVPRHKVPIYLFSCDSVVMNYLKDTLHEKYASTLKVFEYMASGVPIVSSDLPSVREILDDTNAKLVAANDIAELVAGMEETMLEFGTAVARGAKARKDAKKYTWIARANLIIEKIH